MADKPDIVFRGTKNGLHLILNGTQDFDVLTEKLKDHLNKADKFFEGADVTLDAGDMELSIDQILAIQEILAFPYGLHLKKIVYGKDDSLRANGRSRETADRAGKGLRSAGRIQERRTRDVELTSKVRDGQGAFLHKGTLRSGQRISYDGDVVVVGDVNPGAEIRARGDIVVLGTLRGLAHAGAAGSSDAVVVAFNLEPTQIRIGNVIGRPPEGDAGSRRVPEVARVRDGVIVIEPLDESRWEGDR
ncbi:MAG: septum site-determining protein MinC [Firmicutes bacterium]|jgi:septum site-determining protein MinC|nr:septum site-determining protein MinC [Candidatus Fermentithermobacillaceae bacterium]